MPKPQMTLFSLEEPFQNPTILIGLAKKSITIIMCFIPQRPFVILM